MGRRRLSWKKRNKVLKAYHDESGRLYTRYNNDTQEIPDCTACKHIGKEYMTGRCTECCGLEYTRAKCYYEEGED